MMWVTKTRLKIINASNIECLFDITGDLKSKKKSTRKLKLVSSVKIDNEFENLDKRDSPHMIMQPLPLEHEDVLELLIRMNQSYNTSI